MKKLGKIKNFWTSTASKAGGAGRKALETLIPDEVLQNSLFIGGFYDLARNMESLTDEGENGDSTKFFLKKGGGQVIDLATTPLTGMPITMWSALVSDGCGVASWTLKTAADSCDSGEDMVLGKVLETTADGIDKVGDLSKNVNKFFDTPGKSEAGAMLESSSVLLKYAKENSELLGGEVLANATELNQIAQTMAKKPADPEVHARFVENTTAIIDALCKTTGNLNTDLKTFITAPNKKNFVVLSLSLENNFKKVPLFFYKETTRTLRKFPEYAKYIPRPDKEILAVGKIIQGISKETGGKISKYKDHYKGLFDK